MMMPKTWTIVMTMVTGYGDSGPDDNSDSSTDANDDDDQDGGGLHNLVNEIAALNEDNDSEDDGKIAKKIWNPDVGMMEHKARVVSTLASGGAKNKLSADRIVRVTQLKQDLKGTEKAVQPDLGKEEWDIGRESNIAVFIQERGGDKSVSVGRVVRVIRTLPKGTRVEYKRVVRLSTMKDREEMWKKGVTFLVALYKKVKAKEYTFGAKQEAPTMITIIPHQIVCPVNLEFVKGQTWRIGELSAKMIKQQLKNATTKKGSQQKKRK
jgi:hypothetical protein